MTDEAAVRYSIVGERVALGPVRRELYPLHVQWLNDPEVAWNVFGQPVRRTFEEERDWIEAFLSDPASRLWLIYRLDEGRPIGLAALTEIDLPPGSATFRTLIGEARDRGQGFGRESSELVLRHAAEELSLREIRLDVFGYNAAGIRLYERLGFQEVDRRPMQIDRDGRRWDVIRMARRPEAPPSQGREPTRWGFASPGPVRDELTSLALAGVKVVTTGLLAEYQIDGDPVEEPGDISILLDSAERPLALVEDVRSTVQRLADVSDQDAIDEGEGYADAAEFRATHERFWNSYIDEVRAGLGDPSFAIDDDTLVVVERFRIAGLLDGSGSPFEPPVRPAYPPDRPRVDGFLVEHNADVVARKGELAEARRSPALIAETGGELAGVLTWALDGASMEVRTLHVARRWTGVGTVLLEAARRVAEASGARRLWLVTTNDNVDALRFYQRRGWRLAAIDPGAVDRSRASIKPAIPEVGEHGIALRDEIELELWVGGEPRADAASPAPSASPSLADALLALELALARRDEAAIPGGYDAVLHPDFVEIGASGRRWSRAEMLSLLRAEPRNDGVEIDDVEVVPLGPDHILVTDHTRVIRPDWTATRSRRSSTWLRVDGRWQIRFHQGTRLE